MSRGLIMISEMITSGPATALAPRPMVRVAPMITDNVIAALTPTFEIRMVILRCIEASTVVKGKSILARCAPLHHHRTGVR